MRSHLALELKITNQHDHHYALWYYACCIILGVFIESKLLVTFHADKIYSKTLTRLALNDLNCLTYIWPDLDLTFSLAQFNWISLHRLLLSTLCLHRVKPNH